MIKHTCGCEESPYHNDIELCSMHMQSEKNERSVSMTIYIVTEVFCDGHQRIVDVYTNESKASAAANAHYEASLETACHKECASDFYVSVHEVANGS